MTQAISDTPPRQRPSTAFLILLNALILLAPSAIQGNLLSFFFFPCSFIPLVVLLVIIHLIVRKKQLHPMVRTFIFLLPVLFDVGLPALGLLPQRINQQSPLTSPSGRYIATVPIRGGVWKVTLSDIHRNVLYRDDDSSFLGNFNVYWYWDKQDRLCSTTVTTAVSISGKISMESGPSGNGRMSGNQGPNWNHQRWSVILT